MPPQAPRETQFMELDMPPQAPRETQFMELDMPPQAPRKHPRKQFVPESPRVDIKREGGEKVEALRAAAEDASEALLEEIKYSASAIKIR